MVDNTLLVFLLKQEKEQVLDLANAAESNAEGRFDLSNGTVTFTGANTTFEGIEDYGNGWYRCITSYTASCNNQLVIKLQELMDGSAVRC